MCKISQKQPVPKRHSCLQNEKFMMVIPFVKHLQFTSSSCSTQSALPSHTYMSKSYHYTQTDLQHILLMQLHFFFQEIPSPGKFFIWYTQFTAISTQFKCCMCHISKWTIPVCITIPHSKTYWCPISPHRLGYIVLLGSLYIIYKYNNMPFIEKKFCSCVI